MSRLMLSGIVSWLVLASPAAARADDAEDKAVAVVEKLYFTRPGARRRRTPGS